MTPLIAAPKHDPVYVLDANIFIEAKQRYYAFDVCPGFWEALVWHHGNGPIISVDRVKPNSKNIRTNSPSGPVAMRFRNASSVPTLKLSSVPTGKPLHGDSTRLQ